MFTLRKHVSAIIRNFSPSKVRNVRCDAISAPVQWQVADGGNGHWYDLVLESRSWTDANDVASTYVINGSNCHLATVTSAEENAFLVNNFLNGRDGMGFWLGGYQLPNQPSTNVGWNWVTGENWEYTNWWLGNIVPEPNDWPGMGYEDNQENYMGFSHESFGQWNDTSNSESWMRSGYLVESNPVPIPGAIWLFAFGLLGLLGIKRIQ